jgi:hypothetical protein
VFRLRKALTDRQIFLNAEQEAQVFGAALKGTPLEGADLTEHLVKPTPVGRALTEADSPLLKRYLSLKPGENGGRWGGYEVRQLNHALASELESGELKVLESEVGAGKWEVTNGAGRGSEENFRIGDNTVHVDIKATREAAPGVFQTVRVQTVDTLADGVTLTEKEAANVARIREKFPNDKLIVVSKQTKKVIP